MKKYERLRLESRSLSRMTESASRSYFRRTDASHQSRGWKGRSHCEYRLFLIVFAYSIPVCHCQLPIMFLWDTSVVIPTSTSPSHYSNYNG